MNNVRVCVTHAVIINESCLYSLVLPYVGLYTPMPECDIKERSSKSPLSAVNTGVSADVTCDM